MRLRARLTRLETLTAPPRQPATLAALVACTRGEADPDRYDWRGWEPLFQAAREDRDQRLHDRAAAVSGTG